MEKRWRLAPPAAAETRELFPDIPPVVVQLLANRGLVTQEAVDEFLNPDYGQDLHDPYLFRQMEEACARVFAAIEAGAKVAIHGDYDADGVTGTTVLMTTFRAAAEKMGKDPSRFEAFFPHRERDGYGLKPESVRRFAADGAALLITVDCGIGNAAEVDLAHELGLDVIVVDHHQVPERVPDCVILHPLVKGETYPYKSLAAVGVAFKFAGGFLRFLEGRGLGLGAGFEKWLLDLVAIATVTDIMPLLGENRTLERYGLVVLNKTRRPGLRQLIARAGLELGALDTTSIGYYIGPRINAASRMEHAEIAFDCLAAADDEAAAAAAERLNRCNVSRQQATETMYAAARAEVQAAWPKPVVCVANAKWSAGVVGIVAGRLVSDFGVPAFVFGRDGDRFVGSGRSIPEFNVIDAMQEAKGFLARFGGHPQACGLTIDGEENYLGFKAALEAYAGTTLAGRDLRPALDVDAEIPLSAATWELVDWLARFEPHGEANPRPRFVVRDLLLSSAEIIGQKKNTVRLGVRGDLPTEKKVIAFGFASRAGELATGRRYDAVVEIGVNAWNGNREIQLKLVDIKPAEGR